MFIANAYHVMVEIVKRVPHVPHEFSTAFAFAIRQRWNRIVGIAKPPDEIHLFPGAELLGWLGYVMEDGGRFICRRSRAEL
jgi:hypothetical protein